jgi:hypothetical protein
MPKSRRLRGTRRIKSRRMRGGNNPTDSATLDRAEEDAAGVSEPVSKSVSEPQVTGVPKSVSDTEVTGDQSETTMSPSLTDKARKTATDAFNSVKAWLGFGGKSRKNHRKSRKNRRKSRKNRKH